MSSSRFGLNLSWFCCVVSFVFYCVFREFFCVCVWLLFVVMSVFVFVGFVVWNSISGFVEFECCVSFGVFLN